MTTIFDIGRNVDPSAQYNNSKQYNSKQYNSKQYKNV